MHLPELLELFVQEYHAAGGPRITADDLDRHLTLHMAAMGVARVLVFPEIIRFRLPEIAYMSGKDDPKLMAVDSARNCLHVYVNFQKHWSRRDFENYVN